MIYCTTRADTSGSRSVYALLEHAYRLNYEGDLPEVKKTFHGKPYFPDLPDVHFSLSHSSTHVLCALSGSPVGCDIESPRAISRRAIEYFCSAEELELFTPLELWVLKESYVKLFGKTIASIRDLRFSKHEDGTPYLSAGRVDGAHSATPGHERGPAALTEEQVNLTLVRSKLRYTAQKNRPPDTCYTAQENRPPDTPPDIRSKLYYIGDCLAAVCSECDDLPDSVVLI